MPAPKGHPPYNTKGEGGRPLEWTKERIDAEAEAFVEWMQKPDSIYYKRFAFDRGYSVTMFDKFMKISERFHEVYKLAREWQEAKLCEGGLTSKYNPGFTKFVMGNTCGWYDKQQVVQVQSEQAAQVFNETDGQSKDLVK